LFLVPECHVANRGVGQQPFPDDQHIIFCLAAREQAVQHTPISAFIPIVGFVIDNQPQRGYWAEVIGGILHVPDIHIIFDPTLRPLPIVHGADVIVQIKHIGLT